uniref:Uncharacterized protein n=1 Tax=Picea glauca TaxID=3330 RepID=A0A101M3E8_PICGL|nr:hypothetical protein ABT39_MTgene27 [Picea glauca]QHR89345.1 hypothetical protein Q903MT_gene3366 [Picea sitchensis]
MCFTFTFENKVHTWPGLLSACRPDSNCCNESCSEAVVLTTTINAQSVEFMSYPGRLLLHQKELEKPCMLSFSFRLI